MALKTLVKIGGITNLSDARYCAGMGVDILGFDVIPGRPNYISPETFQQIRGWVTGPLIVAEIAGLQHPKELEQIIENYRPDMLQLGLSELSKISTPPLPYILKLQDDERISHLAVQAEYIQSTQRQDLPTGASLLLDVNSIDEVKGALTDSSVRGIALNGGPELKPGLKDYSALADILEFLEVD